MMIESCAIMNVRTQDVTTSCEEVTNLVDIVYVCGGGDRGPEVFFLVVVDIPRVELCTTSGKGMNVEDVDVLTSSRIRVVDVSRDICTSSFSSCPLTT